MAITLVEVYQVLSDVIRQAQEWEAKAQALAQQVQTLEAEVERLRTLGHETEVSGKNKCHLH